MPDASGLAASIWLTPSPLRSAGAAMRCAAGRSPGGSLAAVNVADPAAVAPAEAMDRVGLARAARVGRDGPAGPPAVRGATAATAAKRPAAMRAELGFGADGPARSRGRPTACCGSGWPERLDGTKLIGRADLRLEVPALEASPPGQPSRRGPGPGAGARGRLALGDLAAPARFVAASAFRYTGRRPAAARIDPEVRGPEHDDGDDDARGRSGTPTSTTWSRPRWSDSSCRGGPTAGRSTRARLRGGAARAFSAASGSGAGCSRAGVPRRRNVQEFCAACAVFATGKRARWPSSDEKEKGLDAGGDPASLDGSVTCHTTTDLSRRA